MTMRKPLDPYALYLRRERRVRRLAAVLAWAGLIALGSVVAAVVWAVLVIVTAVLG